MDILVTQRLTMRPPLEVDVEAIAKALNNANITRNLSAVPNPYAQSDASEWVAKTQAETDSLHFTIYRQQLLGVISVKKRNDTYNLGYWVDEPHWGKGYISEAARAVVSYAFRNLPTDDIISGAYVDNPGSLRVLEKLGFEKTHSVQDPNATRQCDVEYTKMKLTRDTFGRLFGLHETNVAA